MELSIAEKRAAVCSFQARRLFSLVRDIIATSPDRSCYASERFLSLSLKIRKQTVNAAKHELLEAGALCLSLRENGRRKNPRHRLSLPPKEARRSRSAHVRGDPDDPCLRDAIRPWYGLAVWADAPRMDLIDFYLKSGLNVTALHNAQKKPLFTKPFWARLTYDQKIDTFYHDPSLGVGLWLDHRYEVFDLDSDRITPPDDTLVSVRSDHAHVFFEASGEIYNTVRKVAPDIDTRGPGGLVVLPPSQHKSGAPYQWLNLTPPKPLPLDYLALWRNRKIDGPASGFHLRELPDRIEYGERNSVLWSFGRSLRAAGANHEYIRTRIRQINAERCKPPFSTHEIERQIKHILSWRDKSDFRTKAAQVA